MTLTHHPVRLFRLSCGCLRAYPMMPAGTQHTVLCVNCRAAAVTVFTYPEGRCAARGWAVVDGRRTAVSCTNAKGSCSWHHTDSCTGVEFTVTTAPVAQSREGKTGRA